MMKLFHFVAIACFVVGCTRTEYSRPDLGKQFDSVEIGDSISEVYRKVGPPFFISVNPDPSGEGWARSKTIGADKVSEVIDFLSDPRAEAALHYSRPKSAGDNYFLYEVDLRKGRVVRKVGPAYMD